MHYIILNDIKHFLRYYKFMEELAKYIVNTLGLELDIRPLPDNSASKLPLYLQSIYNFQIGRMISREVVFAISTDEKSFTADQLKKQSSFIGEALNLPVVFIFKDIPAYFRKRLIEKLIAFIIPQKQMYIPFLFMDLKEYKQRQNRNLPKLFPAAQCLFFYCLLNDTSQLMNFEKLASAIGYGKMTITRATITLLDFGLGSVKGKKNKSLVIERNSRTWEKAVPYIINPVEKQIELCLCETTGKFFYSGDMALSHYTNLIGSDRQVLAFSKTEYDTLVKKCKPDIHGENNKSVQVQSWKYSPAILARGEYVDPLSVYSIFKDLKDERIQSELNNLIERIW